MKNYNYREAVKNDVVEALEDNCIWSEIEDADIQDFESLAEFLEDMFWTEDSITGNGSGSYTFNRYQAGEYLKGNAHLVRNMIEQFGIEAEEVGERFLSEDWEWFDVSIRCSLLRECIEAALVERYAFEQ